MTFLQPGVATSTLCFGVEIGRIDNSGFLFLFILIRGCHGSRPAGNLIDSSETAGVQDDPLWMDEFPLEHPSAQKFRGMIQFRG